MNRLQGKVAILTGAASGLGVTHAELLVAEGARVVLTDIVRETGEFLAHRLGPATVFRRHDVTDPSSWTEVVAATAETFGPPSVLVNNAGMAGPQATTLEVAPEDYCTTIEVDQYGVFLGMQAVLPVMLEAGGGSIINLSSAAGMAATVGFPNIAYVAAKFAVRGMTKAVAIEYAARGIRANSVHPGGVMTPLTVALLEQVGPELREAFEATVPVGRLATPVEVSHAVVYLASDESAYVTGTEIVIDGGLLAQ